LRLDVTPSLASNRTPPMSEPRTAVVTGASAGVGKAACRQLLDKGWSVIGVGRDPARCTAAEAELKHKAFTMLRADLASLEPRVSPTRSPRVFRMSIRCLTMQAEYGPNRFSQLKGMTKPSPPITLHLICSPGNCYR
jgi:short chain dehydrogenase